MNLRAPLDGHPRGHHGDLPVDLAVAADRVPPKMLGSPGIARIIGGLGLALTRGGCANPQ
jgi:hypothetical protein